MPDSLARLSSSTACGINPQAREALACSIERAFEPGEDNTRPVAGGQAVSFPYSRIGVRWKVRSHERIVDELGRLGKSALKSLRCDGDAVLSGGSFDGYGEVEGIANGIGDNRAQNESSQEPARTEAIANAVACQARACSLNPERNGDFSFS